MKKAKLIFLFIIGILSVTGCTANKDSYSIQTPENSIFYSAYNLYDNGFIYINQTNAAEFIDYETLVNTPVCNKPNCRHNDDYCISKLVTSEGNLPIVYHDSVYYFTFTDEIIESKDGRSTSYDIQSQLNKIDLHSGKRETVAEFSDMEATSSNALYLENGVLYFIALNGSLQDNTGAWYYFSTSGSQYFCSIDLNTGKFVNYGQINNPEKAKSTLFCVEGGGQFGAGGNVIVDGIYDNKIWMHYSYADSADAIYTEYKKTGNFPGNDSPIMHRENVVFDLDTKKIEVSDKPDAACIGEGYYIYWDDNKNGYISEKEGKEIILEGFSKTFYTSYLRICNNILWNLENEKCFDLKNGTISEFSKKYNDKGVDIYCFKDNRYIINYYDEASKKIVFENVDEADLIKRSK